MTDICFLVPSIKWLEPVFKENVVPDSVNPFPAEKLAVTAVPLMFIPVEDIEPVTPSEPVIV